jgi:hypothetical protein
MLVRLEGRVGERQSRSAPDTECIRYESEGSATVAWGGSRNRAGRLPAYPVPSSGEAAVSLPAASRSLVPD